ncbi:MAG: major capsid protein [Microviridae sp.]|nr:MAG: major capsid protein [Microviridae sp.]
MAGAKKKIAPRFAGRSIRPRKKTINKHKKQIKMQKTLGGDRLGSGNKMKVNLHGYERSTHDMGYIWRSTMSAGTLVPYMCEIGLPGDTFDINLDADIKTHPATGPLFGSYKVQLDVFQAPIRLYNSLLHNNALGIGLKMENVKLPVLELFAPAIPLDDIPDYDNSQINPSCILSYLGIRGIGYTTTPDTPRLFNGVPLLAYWDIYKNYYANKQEEIGAVIHTPFEAIIETVDTISIGGDNINTTPTVVTNGTLIDVFYTGTTPQTNQIYIEFTNRGYVLLGSIVWSVIDLGTNLQCLVNVNWTDTAVGWRYKNATDQGETVPLIQTFDLEQIDLMRAQILANAGTSAFNIFDSTLQPYIYLQNGGTVGAIVNSQEGLGLKTYQSDLFNNWLLTEYIDGVNGISAVTAVDTSGGSFTIDTLNLAKKVYNMLNRIAVSGGSYDDWLDAVYAHDRYQRCETPMYMGGLIKELVFQEVVSNTESADQPLGTLAGKGVLTHKHKGGHIIVKVDEPSYIIGIISLTPRLDYSQGNKWDVNLKTLNDLHKPALDEIGFQDLIEEQMAWWTTHWDSGTNEWIQQSAGKQPAWINYMTNVNQTRGNFAVTDNEMFMTLNRRYQPDDSGGGLQINIKDLTTYIDPSLYNFIFADTAIDSQNFWAQIAVDITARRKMSAKLMPNL